MKPTAPLRNKLSVFATTPCRVLVSFSLGSLETMGGDRELYYGEEASYAQ
jgi:hypothetical protein